MKEDTRIKNGSFIKVTFAESTAEAEQILQFLKENGIGGYRQGGVLDVYTGNSNTGEDIFVHETDAEKAQNMLSSFTPIKVSSGFCREHPSGARKIMSWILLGIILLFIGLSLYTAVF